MIIRVLYLLLRQRLDQWRSRKPAPENALSPMYPPGGPSGPAVSDKNRPRRAFAVALAAAAAALAFAWHQAYRVDGTVSAESIPASLILEVQAQDHWPLAIYLTGGDLAPPQPQEIPAGSRRIESIHVRFAPEFQVLPPASELEIVNSDPIPHNTHVFHRGETIFNVGLPTQGVTVHKTLTGNGIFSVRCDLHPTMQAWLFVPPSPHYAVVRQPQTVRFDDLAPGEYVLHLWQADTGESYRLVNLDSGERKVLHLR